MKTYNNFNEMFNANKSVKSDLSVFNIKLSADTCDCFKQFIEWIKENGSLNKNNPEGYEYEAQTAACLLNDLFLPENKKDYPVTTLSDLNNINDFCADAVDYVNGNGLVDVGSLCETAGMVLTNNVLRQLCMQFV